MEFVDNHHQPRRRGMAACRCPCAWPSATRRSRCFSSSSNACSARTACCRSRSHTLPTQCGSPFERAERRTAFEVEKHELQTVRRVACGQGEAPALQQYGFARSRGSGNQRVRPLPLQVQMGHARVASILWARPWKTAVAIVLPRCAREGVPRCGACPAAAPDSGREVVAGFAVRSSTVAAS